MPRRFNEVVTVPEPPRKKSKALEEVQSLDVSYFDDEALPPGIIFSDVQQKQWRLGKPIGRGSFGRIYLASDEVDKEVTKQNARFVVKIEPHTNGPLFVEVHCLIRTAQAKKVNNWRTQKKQKHFGMPVYIASGSFTDETTDAKYRFLVLPRYDTDLQKVIARTRVLDIKTVLILGIQILDVLEYFHGQGYTHSDIKSSNLMLGFDGEKFNSNTQKQTLSFQKEVKEISVLSGKQKKTRTTKSSPSNYYDDEDFIVKDRSSLNSSNDESEKDKRLANVKNKLRKIISDRDYRTLHRHHAFNLRQLSGCVNYEDFDSSESSDQSYQKLLDNFDSKQKVEYSSDEGFHDDPKLNKSNKIEANRDDVFKEAVLTQSSGQIYLLDYGLASKFLDADGNHKDFGMDARKAHDGTLEYSSRDSHIGAHSRRSDLETLGYNLLDWMTGTLPWKTTEVLAEPDLVHAIKKNFMSDIKSLLRTCFKSDYYPQFMESYLQYITSLDFTEKPDYDHCRNIFRAELAKIGCVDKELSLNFEQSISPMKRKLGYTNRFGKKTDFAARNGVRKKYERENICSFENDLKLELLKQTLNSSSDGVRKPCSSRNFFISDADLIARLKKSLMPHDVFGKKLSPKNLRSQKRIIKKRRGKRGHRSSIGKFGNFMGSARQFTWAEILAGNPEDIIRKNPNTANNSDDEDDENTCKYRIRKLSNASDSTDSNNQSPILQKDYLQGSNPTYAMKEVIANLKKRIAGKEDVEEEGIEGYTPAMMKMYKIKEKREAKERLETAKQVKNETESRSTRSKKVKTPVASKTRKKMVETKPKLDESVVDKTRSLRNRKCSKNKEKDEVKVEKEIKPVAVAAKKPAKRTKTAVVMTNRRMLRSSRRIKK